MAGRPRVVVVGGGFAGLSAVRALDGADVEYNTFQPLLHQVATGGLNPGDVTYALRAFAARHPNAQFRRMAVSGVDAERRCVRTDDGERLPSAATIWATGVKVHAQVAGWGCPRAVAAASRWSRTCGWSGRPEIFAVGDVAASVDGALPQPAQPAIQGGRHAAAQIRRLLAGQPTEPMAYKDKGPWPRSAAPPPWSSCPGG